MATKKARPGSKSAPPKKSGKKSAALPIIHQPGPAKGGGKKKPPVTGFQHLKKNKP